MRKPLLVLALALLLAGCAQAEPPPEEEPGETDEYAALIAAAPVAQVEGEAVSPDGRFEVRQTLYQCSVWKVDKGGVTVESREKTLETLGSWDFTHDGRPETVELETIWFPGGTGTVRDYSIFRVLDGEGVLWEDYAAALENALKDYQANLTEPAG